MAATGRLSFTLCAALASVTACSTSTPPTGLRIDVNLNGATVDTLKVSVSASPGGFMMAMGSNEDGVTLSNETDARGAQALVVLFKSPYAFQPTVSFRLDTANGSDLSMSASALAFNGGALVAGAEPTAGVTLLKGGAATLEVTLMTKMGIITPDTKTTDLAGDLPGVAVLGAQPAANGIAPMSSLAICDVDGDGAGDFVIGAPNVDGPGGLTGSGAVYIAFGDPSWDTSSKATIDLANPSANPVVFYGAEIADHLGAAIACADLDGNGLGDIVVGAPDAGNGSGRIYLLHGRRNIHTTRFDLTTADAEWLSTAQTPARLGAGLFVADLDGDGTPEILATAAGAAKVHLFKNVAASTTPHDAEAADHVTFSGVVPTALGAGDLNGDTMPDVALGDAAHFPAGAADPTGAVFIFAGVDPSATTAYVIDSATLAEAQTRTITGPAKSQFGAALLVVDSSGRGPDLVVGAPSDAGAAGSVYLFQNDSEFFHSAMTDASTMMPVRQGPVPGGRFGGALAAPLSGPAGNLSADLVVGALATPRGARAKAGAVYLFKGGQGRLFPLVAQLYGAKDNDQLGTFVAGGLINGMGEKVGDFAALAPNAAGSGANSGAGVVYGMFGSP